jgi:hypothetical protein
VLAAKEWGFFNLLAAKIEGKKTGECSSLAARLIIISDTFMYRAIHELIDSLSLFLIQILTGSIL